MTSTDATDRRDELVKRLFGATIGTLELYGVYLGDRLGLYAALADGGALDPDDLARRAGIDPRYAREWLEQQAVAGIVDAEDAGNGNRTYRLPAEHADVLGDPESALYLAPFASLVTGIGGVLPEVADAYRVDQPADPTGTVLREPTVRDLADQAGFASVEVLPIENDFFRFYRLRR